MNKIAHNIEFSVFVKEEEDTQKAIILEKLRSFIPFDLVKEKVTINTERAKSFNERVITIETIRVSKNRHVRAVLEHLKQGLTQEQRSLLLKQAETRLDSENHFFIRFDMKAMLEEEKLKFTDSGKCFHCRISIAGYPQTKENALKILNFWLGQQTI